ncbi:hypothetical protein [Singulisphaera sp. PoT]|uniref:hypothetical protein n=1 Tax=Singulisphaera sp. PoT TaxID=3411797 RepID=UPI003BF51B17
MFHFRVPYPVDPGRRKDLFSQAVSKVSSHGKLEGTPDRGTFEGKTIIGNFAGSYRAIDASAELEIQVTEKPWLVTNHMIEREFKKVFPAIEV